MGCCPSRTAGASGTDTTAVRPHPYIAPTSDHAAESSRNITASSPQRPSSVASHSQPQKSIAPNLFLRPIDPNRRCALPDPFTFPTSTSCQNPDSTPWTRAKLEKERQDWWETRDSGSRIIWEAYRQMVRHLQLGEVQEAQTLLDAAGCTCPTGKLWYAIYDERGVEYAIKDRRRNYEWLVFEPTGLCTGDERGQGERVSEEDDVVVGSGKGKGKGRADEEGEVLQVRCRLSSSGRDCVIKIRKGEKIGSIRASLSRVTGFDERRLRISYLGRLYAPHEALPTEGPRAWSPNNVLTVLVMEEVDDA